MLKKRKIETIVIIVFVSFIIVSLVIPFERNETFWISFVFGVVSIAAQFVFGNIAFKNSEGSAKSKFYGFPIIRIGIYYMILQISLSFLLMTLSKWVPVWVSICLFVVILTLAIIGLIASETTRQVILTQENNVLHDIANMRAMTNRLSVLSSQIDNVKICQMVKKLEEEFKYSDPVSNEKRLAYEEQLLIKIDELEPLIRNNENEIIIEKNIKIIRGLLAERNNE